MLTGNQSLALTFRSGHECCKNLSVSHFWPLTSRATLRDFRSAALVTSLVRRRFVCAPDELVCRSTGACKLIATRQQNKHLSRLAEPAAGSRSSVAGSRSRQALIGRRRERARVQRDSRGPKPGGVARRADCWGARRHRKRASSRSSCVARLSSIGATHGERSAGFRLFVCLMG